jgi:hypothetical protein
MGCKPIFSEKKSVDKYLFLILIILKQFFRSRKNLKEKLYVVITSL